MDTVEAPALNGIAEQLPSALGPTALRRLGRLQARLDGATEVAQAAVDAHTRARDAYQAAFVSACEDAGIPIPPGPHEAEIDWATGDVAFKAGRT